MKRILLSVVLLLVIRFVYGQFEKPFIAYEFKEYNFGTINESDGLASVDFNFVNTGKVPLIINHVQASCGCTAPVWTREPVVPNQEGSIKVTYNPKGRPGSFVKMITVMSNANPGIDTLIIRGSVVATPLAKPLENTEYKYSIGDLKLQTVYASFGQLYMGGQDTVSIAVFNGSSSATLRPGFPDVPGHITVRFEPEILPPGTAGKIIFNYNTTARNEWDYVIDRLHLTLNGKTYPSNLISLTAIVKEDFSKLTAQQLADAPVAGIDSTVFDFGTIKDDVTVEHDFVLTNQGKSDLIIRKVSASCGCTAVTPVKTIIPPGGSTMIKVAFNAHGRNGINKKSVTLITNDPKKPKMYLWIKTLVESQVAQNNP